MNKLVGISLSTMMALGLSTGTVSAKYTGSVNVNGALLKAQEYYKGQKVLSSSDEVIAVETLGLEAESSSFTLDKDYKASLSKLDSSNVGSFTKGVMANALLGNDTSGYKKQLEGIVKSDGSIEKSLGVNSDIYALMALEMVKSDKVGLVADHVAADQLSNGAYWYSMSGKKYSDDSITGWAVEALRKAGSKYTKNVDKAEEFLNTGLHEDGSYDTSGWGGNADTQAAVIEGLSTGDYKNDKAVNYLLSYQDNKGYFTSGGSYNAYTTVSGSRALGTMVNGSILDKAKRDYDKTKHPTKNYQLTNGNKTTITKGQSFIFSTDMPQKDIQSISVDGNEIDRSYYTVNQTITLNANYLNTLALGQHTIVISALDGKASGTFTLIAPQEEVKKPVQPVQEVKQPIKKAPSTTPVKQEKKVVKSYKVVDTSDSTDIELYVLLVILTGLGIVLLRRYRHV